MKIEEGSKWVSGDHRIFIVNTVETIENRLWVKYSRVGEMQEYSCYAESFVSRFTPYINN